MRFNLTQSCYHPDIEPLLRLEIKRKLGALSPLSKDELKEIAEISKSIQKNTLPPHLVRKKLNPELGYGIFLHPKAPPLVKGQVVGIYAGEIVLVAQNAPDESAYAFALIDDILLDKQAQLKWDSAHRYHPKRLYSFKLDAWKTGNFTRFINHSEKPNLISYMVCVPKNHYGITPSPIEVVYFVKKKIQPGEQLLVSYERGQKNYWQGHKGEAFPMTPQTFRLNQHGTIE